MHCIGSLLTRKRQNNGKCSVNGRTEQPTLNVVCAVAISKMLRRQMDQVVTFTKEREEGWIYLILNPVKKEKRQKTKSRTATQQKLKFLLPPPETRRNPPQKMQEIELCSSLRYDYCRFTYSHWCINLLWSSVHEVPIVSDSTFCIMNYFLLCVLCSDSIWRNQQTYQYFWRKGIVFVRLTLNWVNATVVGENVKLVK